MSAIPPVEMCDTCTSTVESCDAIAVKCLGRYKRKQAKEENRLRVDAARYRAALERIERDWGPRSSKGSAFCDPYDVAHAALRGGK